MHLLSLRSSQLPLANLSKLKWISYQLIRCCSGKNISQESKIPTVEKEVSAPKVCLTSKQRKILETCLDNVENNFSLQTCLLEENVKFLQETQKKLENIHHPVCDSVAKNYKSFMEDSNFDIRLPSVISLLYSKAIGVPKKNQNISDRSSIWNKQTTMAETAVIERTASMFHREIQTFKPIPENSTSKKLEMCNKQITLSGDLLYGLASQNIASLRNSQVLDLYASVICNLTMEEFIWGNENKDDHKLAYIQGKDQWEYRNDLFFSSSLANFIASGLLLADHSDHLVDKGMLFGKYTGFVIQAHNDIKKFLMVDSTRNQSIDLLSLPVALHLKNNPDAVFDFFTWGNRTETLDYQQLWKSVNEAGSLEQSIACFKTYKKKALNLVEDLPDIDSSKLLSELVSSYELVA